MNRVLIRQNAWRYLSLIPIIHRLRMYLGFFFLFFFTKTVKATQTPRVKLSPRLLVQKFFFFEIPENAKLNL